MKRRLYYVGALLLLLAAAALLIGLLATRYQSSTAASLGDGASLIPVAQALYIGYTSPNLSGLLLNYSYSTPSAQSAAPAAIWPVQFTIASNPYVSATYTPLLSVTNVTLYPGSNETINITLSGSSMPVTITVPSFSILGHEIQGGTYTVYVDPLGNNTYPVPGLTTSINAVIYSLSGGLYLTVTGEVTGTVEVYGNGTGPSGETLTWTSPGTQSIQIRAYNVSSGNVTVSLENLTYTISIMISFQYNYQSVSATWSGSYTLVGPITLGSFRGDPSSVSVTYKIVHRQTPRPFLISLSNESLLAPYLVFLLTVAVATPLSFRRRRA